MLWRSVRLKVKSEVCCHSEYADKVYVRVKNLKEAKMPFRIGFAELVLILAIVLLFFGPGRIGRLGGELGKAIKGFKSGFQDDKAKEEGTD